MSEKVKRSLNYAVNLKVFASEMMREIEKNMEEKGHGWRLMTNDDLRDLIVDYTLCEDWVSVGNIAFMLWENDGKNE